MHSSFSQFLLRRALYNVSRFPFTLNATVMLFCDAGCNFPFFSSSSVPLKINSAVSCNLGVKL